MNGFGFFALCGAVVLSAVFAVRWARGVALRRALLDLPNERSSHRVPVPRLGGAAFVPLVWLALTGLALGTGRLDGVAGALLAGVAGLYGISLADDFLNLPSGVRFAVQGAVAGLLLAALVVRQPAGYDFLGAWLGNGPGWTGWVSVAGLGLWLVGTVNLYNFMDGIDGIAGVQAVVAGLAWALWGAWVGAAGVLALGALVAAAAAGFLTLNWPPARIFMGDAGSTVLGFLLAAAPLLAAQEAPGAVPFDRLLIAGALVLWPFLLDGTFTLFRRLAKRENILQAHRSHLYQRLVIAGRSHQTVTLVYGALAGVGVGLGSRVVLGVPGAVPWAVGGVGILFAGLWSWVGWEEARGRRVAP